jgi:hypothetical protein
MTPDRHLIENTMEMITANLSGLKIDIHFLSNTCDTKYDNYAQNGRRGLVKVLERLV